MAIPKRNIQKLPQENSESHRTGYIVFPIRNFNTVKIIKFSFLLTLFGNVKLALLKFRWDF